MMRIDYREQFMNIVKEHIHRNGIEDLISFLSNNEFFTSPASTKYHGNYEGGLCEHSVNVYNCLKDELITLYGDRWEERYSHESVAIVSLFHDLCKINKYRKSFKNVKNPETGEWEQIECFEYNNNQPRLGHGSSSVYMLMDYIKLTEIEKQAIHWHMGAFDISQYNSTWDLGDTFNKNTLAFALHIADMTATYIDENPFFRPIQTIDSVNDSVDIE
jgi:hypothetical protein